jgi:hypothetical protein
VAPMFIRPNRESNAQAPSGARPLEKYCCAGCDALVFPKSER